MNTFQAEFWDIAAGLLVTLIGLLALAISFFRLKTKEYSLLTFGIFGVLYGVRWLVQTSTMRAMMGAPYSDPEFNRVLTYTVVIPLAAFLVQNFGRGLYDSMLWVYRSTIAYALLAVGYDLIRTTPPSELPINPYVLVLWCIVWGGHLLFTPKKHQVELQIFRIISAVPMACIVQDQLVNMQILSWNVHLEHAGFGVYSIGLAYVAAHRFFSNERKLLAIEQEIEIARRIQRSNLPSTFANPNGLDISARYLPMTTVAGDFYDIHATNNGGIGILVADVSGHGVGAALIGSMLKVAFASQAKHLADPARVLTEINHILRGKIEQSFVTAFCLYVEPSRKTMVYANAGHPPPFLWRRVEQRTIQLPAGGLILGPFPDAAYERSAIKLVNGDRLVIYTDGLPEAQNKAGEFFGDERIQDFVAQHPAEPSGRLADELIRHIQTWSGRLREASFDDDLTLIVLDVVTKLMKAR